MKKIVLVGLGLFLIGGVFGAVLYSNAQYYVRDKVNGRNLQVTDFVDELGIIDSLVYNDLIKKNYNTFSGEIGYGVAEDGTEFYILNNPKFEGRILFDDNSKVEYKLTDISVDSTGVDEFGATQAYATGNFTYEATIKIKKSLPVEALFNFFEDEESSEYNQEEIKITGEDFSFQLESGEGKSFNHQRKCLAGCE